MKTEPKWLEIYKMAERMAKHYTKTKTEVTELMSNAVVHLYSKIRLFREGGKASFKTWAYKVMRNCMLQQMRQWQKEKHRFCPLITNEENEEVDENLLHSYDPLMSAIFPDITMEWNYDFTVKWKAFFSALRPLEHKIALALIRNRNATCDEIAVMVGAQSGASVRVHLTSIRRKLQVYLKQLN